MPPPLTEQLAQCGELTVLLVDDEPSFRQGLAGALRDDGHTVLDFVAVERLPALASLGHVTLVVTDYDMPGQSGLRLADRFHATHPNVPIVIVASNITGELERAAAVRPYVRLISKHFDYDDLHGLIHDLAGPF